MGWRLGDVKGCGLTFVIKLKHAIEEELMESECSAIATQNTNRSVVYIYYPYHPYSKMNLVVTHYPKRRAEWVTVSDPQGNSLKIPIWMLSPSAKELSIVSTPAIGIQAIMALLSLIPDEGGHHEANGIYDRQRRGGFKGSGTRNSRKSREIDGADSTKNQQSTGGRKS